MHDADRLRKFLFEHLPVRGELVHLDQAWRQVLDNGEYPPAIRVLLGEALAASVLLASTLKFDGLLTLQLAGNGPMHLLVAQCSSDQEVRGLAKWRGEVGDAGLETLAGSGRLTIGVDTGQGGERYQGIVPITGNSLAESLETYFRQSVQVPTRLWLESGRQAASGMLLQRLPEAYGDEAELAWEHVQALADTLSGDELAGLQDEAILRRLFSEDDLRLFDSIPVAFRCSCSQGRVETTLKMLGRDELDQLIAEQGRVDVRCEFCNRLYRFDPVDTASLFVEMPTGPGYDTLH